MNKRPLAHPVARKLKPVLRRGKYCTFVKVQICADDVDMVNEMATLRGWREDIAEGYTLANLLGTQLKLRLEDRIEELRQADGRQRMWQSHFNGFLPGFCNLSIL